MTAHAPTTATHTRQAQSVHPDAAAARRVDRGLDAPPPNAPRVPSAVETLEDELVDALHARTALCRDLLVLAAGAAFAREREDIDAQRYGAALLSRERAVLLEALDGGDAYAHALTPGPRAVLLEVLDGLQAVGAVVSRKRWRAAALAFYGAVLDREFDALAAARAATADAPPATPRASLSSTAIPSPRTRTGAP